MKITTSIDVRFAVTGWHHWPMAPEHRAYLGESHRHLFGVTVELEVMADDREVEFHDLQEWAKREFGEGDFGSQSCEMLARRLLNKIADRFPGRRISVRVDEDGECGATVLTAQPDQRRPQVPPPSALR